jgi:hypothetical protein
MQINCSFPLLNRSRIITICSILTVLVLLNGCSNQPITKSVPQHKELANQVTLDPSVLTNNIASDFLGDGVEPYRMCEFVRLYHATPAMANLLMNLGHGIIRFGGGSVDYTHWVPNGTASCDSFNQTTITKALLDSAFNVVKSLGRQATFSINLANGNPATSADEAAYAVKTAGSTLLAIEIGNEPDLNTGWDYSQFQSKWEANYNAISAVVPNEPIIGPSLCCNDPWYYSFLSQNASQLAFASNHNYPTAAENKPTITEFLGAPFMKTSADKIKSLAAAAHAKGLQFNLNETNAVAETPPDNIGGAFVMSLWGLDYAFTAAENGADAMEFHGAFPGDATSPFNSNGNSVFPRPLYYGMLAFHYATGDSAKIVPVHITSTINLHAHAVLRSDGKLSVILINDDTHGKGITVGIDTTKSYTSASALRLSAPSLAAQVNSITFGGSKVIANGTWTPTQVEPVSINGSTSSIFVPAESAVVVTFS